MKKIVVILSLLPITLFSQNNVCYIKSNKGLYIEPCKKSFHISYMDTTTDNMAKKYDHQSPFILYKPLSRGEIIRNDSIIKLQDKKLHRYYMFKFLDSNTIVSTKSTKLFGKNDTLKVYWSYDKDFTIGYSASWKSNKKNGNWFFIKDNKRYRLNYSNDILLDSSIWDKTKKWIIYSLDTLGQKRALKELQ